jgi:phosphoribosyl 1,2-cyclic phosphate phosphodiesterase
VKVLVMGSGTSTGVPVIGCQCSICLSSDLKDRRTRASIALQNGGGWVIVDTGPDFRAQILSQNILKVKAVLYTHIHADHCHGFDDLRAFSFQSSEPIPCYLMSEHLTEFKVRFAYAFEDTGYTGSKPVVDLREIPEQPFFVQDLEVEPIRLPHGHFTTCGFRFGNFAYITDFKAFPDAWIPKWKGKIHTLVASGIHFKPHPAHSSIPETCELFARLEVKRGIITHLSHKVAFERDSINLPKDVFLAYDGMVIDL